MESQRATKIVATIGPGADDPRELEKLLRAGVDVARLNAAHSRPGQIKRRAASIRAIERILRRPIGILLDLGGPKIRVAPIHGGAVVWATGDEVQIVPGRAMGSDHRIGVTYPALLNDVQPGAEIRLDDGRIRLRVEGRSAGALKATVLTGGKVKTGAGVNFPSSALSAPALTPKDRRDLREGLQAGVDFVGLSFVRSVAHVEALRKLLRRVPEDRRPWIVSKIERAEALASLEAIARVSDVLMVARGDLGVEIGLTAVPRAQRKVLSVGQRLAVPVIVATQMLESIMECATPTRAEVSDVALAVHDGADAVMLSGETAVGRFPVEAVKAMAEIAVMAEAPDPWAASHEALEARPLDFAAQVATIACQAARLSQAKAMVVFTEYGRTARLASKNPLSIPIYVFTPREEVRRRLTVLRDVVSFRVPKARSVEEMIRAAERILKTHAGLAGETVVELSGMAPTEGATNTVRIRRLSGRHREL